MFPNFCFSRKSNEYGLSVKTQQCLKDTRTTIIKKRKKSPCKSPVKSPRRLAGGSCMVTNDGTGVHVNSILKKTLCKKNTRKRSRSTSPVKNNLNEEKQKTKNPPNAERSVNFNLTGTKCRCGNCTITRSDIRRLREKECELRRAEFNRMRELQINRAEQRRERKKRLHNCLMGADKESDQESSEEYQEQKKLSAVLEQLREQQQKRLASFLADQNRQTEVSEDDADGSKRLEESCADFLNIVHDNILETVQTAIQDKLSKYYDCTINKINCLTAQVARNESLLNRINTELLEKIRIQNEVNNNQLKFIVQKLNEQKPSQLEEEDHDVHIESSSSSNVDNCGTRVDDMNAWLNDQNKDKRTITQQQSIPNQIQEQQQSSQFPRVSQPKLSNAKKNCQCEHHSNHLFRQQQYQQVNPQLSREQFEMQQQVQQFANYQMMNDDNKNNKNMNNNNNNNMQFPYPMSCQNYLMWLNWNLAAQYTNQNCCQYVKGNSTSKKPMLSSTTTSTTSRTRFKRTCKRFGSTSLPNIHASKAKLHARSCLISNRSSSPRFMNIVNVASQHSEQKRKS